MTGERLDRGKEGCSVSNLSRRTRGAHAAWTVADQVVSAVSNVLFLLAVARVSSPADLGVVSATFAGLTALLSISRASLGNMIGISSARSRGDFDRITGHAQAVVIGLSVVCSVGVAGVGLASDGSVAPALVAMIAITTPVVLAQDVLRFKASSTGRSGRALAADSAWAALVAGAFIAGPRLPGGVDGVLLVWASGAVISAIMLVVAVGGRPQFTGLKRWLQSERSFLVNSVGGRLAGAGGNVLRLMAIGAMAGAAVVGALSAGQLLMTPMNFLVSLIPFLIVPMVARRQREGIDPVREYGKLAVLFSSAGFAWWVACKLTPNSLGEAILGDNWEASFQLLTPMTVMSIGILLSTLGLSLLLLVGRSRAYGRVSATTPAISIIAALVVLVADGGVMALAWAEALSMVLTAGVAWLVVLHGGHGRRRGSARHGGDTEHSEGETEGGL